jgi:hypothetical protein
VRQQQSYERVCAGLLVAEGTRHKVDHLANIRIQIDFLGFGHGLRVAAEQRSSIRTIGSGEGNSVSSSPDDEVAVVGHAISVSDGDKSRANLAERLAPHDVISHIDVSESIVIASQCTRANSQGTMSSPGVLNSKSSRSASSSSSVGEPKSSIVKLLGRQTRTAATNYRDALM